MASKQAGMGSMPIPGGGVGFRVWAPFAQKVFVAGEFNGWSETTNPLEFESNGNWSADISSAKTGNQYRYVIHPLNSGDHTWHTDPRARRVYSEDDPAGSSLKRKNNGFIVEPNYFWDFGSFGMPGFNELVIYQLHVATFNAHGEVGNFDSLTEKLDYLKDLGINAIELLPIFGFPGKHSLGYNPAFPFDIESSYGGDNEFREFIKAAHEKGIAVIVDVVYNHFGPDELDASLRRIDGWFENGGDGIYFYNHAPRKDWFGPRPDYGRSEVFNYIQDNIRMWLDEYHVDGFRFDSTIGMRNAYGHNNDSQNDIPEGWWLMQTLNYEIKHQPSAKITIAEDLQDNEWLIQPSAFNGGGAGFDAQWVNKFYWDIHNAVVAKEDIARNMFTVRDAIEQRYGSDAFSRIIFSENHDQVRKDNGRFRLPDEIDLGHADGYGARKLSTLAAAVVLTAPGIPMLFQGQEFLEWEAWTDTTPLDWSKKDSLIGSKIFNLYRDLVRLRRNWYNNTRGLQGQHIHVHHVNNTDKVIAYHCWQDGGPGDDVVVVVNFGHKTFSSYSLGLPREGLWWVRFNSDSDSYSPDFGNFGGYPTTAVRTAPNDPDFMPCRGNVGIAPYSMLSLSQ